MASFRDKSGYVYKLSLIPILSCVYRGSVFFSLSCSATNDVDTISLEKRYFAMENMKPKLYNIHRSACA